MGGILIADYFVIRRTRLDLEGLYKKDGPYWYSDGFNPLALIALVLGILPCVPGFPGCHFRELEGQAFRPIWSDIYNYAWFISFGISFVVYVALTAMFGRRNSAKS